MQTICPFHDDINPSFILRPETGQWNCFGCLKGGGPVTFIQEYLKVSKRFAQYVVDFYKKQSRLPLPELKNINEMNDVLLNDQELLKYFGQHGVTKTLLKEFKIGWNIEKQRIVFPIPSETRKDIFLNLRQYRPKGIDNKQAAKVVNIKSLGESTYYPFKAFNEEVIYLVEGEKDMLVGRGRGLNTITGTGGGTTPKHNNNLFKDKIVYIMTDTDEAGDKIAQEYFKVLKPYAKELIRIKLPKKDLADAVVDDFNINVLDYIEDEKVIKESEIKNLSDIFLPKNKDTLFKVNNLRVTGEHMKDYQIPCKVGEFDLDERTIISFLDSPDNIKNKIIAGATGLDPDDLCDMETIEVSAQKIYFKEDINLFSKTLNTGSYENLSGIYLSNGKKIKSNKVYDMDLIRTTHPKTQENIFIITNANECIYDDNVDLKALEIFRREDNISDLIDEYYSDWSPVLEVTGRKDLFTILLLSFLSVLEFEWRNSTIKGWLDSIIVGDTRTGKTKMVRNFMNTLQMGEYVSGENAKATGIIGGINKLKDSWTLNWGKIPINDKRLVIIDEASGMTVEDISMLSQMRSEGILSITKIKQETTYARTRLLWLTNPRSGERINNHYWKGYEVLEKFLPVQEDLARFDLACSAAIEDVDNIFEYSEKDIIDEEKVEKWRQLVLFAWNIPKEKIILNDDIRKIIIDKSMELGRKFNNSVLFLTVNGYEKLTRIAIALAILTFNYKDDQLIIEERHVNYAADFIIDLYEKDSFGLADKVRTENKKTNISDYDKKVLDGMSKIYPNLKLLFRDGEVPQQMISTILGVDYQEANKIIADLYSMGLIYISGESTKIKPTSAFMEYIRNS